MAASGDDYHTGVCSCTEDMNNCLDVFFCWGCQIGRLCNAVQYGQINEQACLHCVCGCFYPMVWATCLRCKMADRFSLPEGCCYSAICGLFFPQCSICQVAREVTLRGTWQGGTCFQQAPPTYPM